MENYDKVFFGTEIKLSVHIDPIGNNHMKNYDWKIEAWTNPKKVISITKSENNKYENDDTVIIEIDTSLVGLGSLKLRVIAEIPDSDSSEDTRREVVGLATNILIVDI